MIINKPYIERKKDKVYVKTNFTIGGIVQDLWYSYPAEYYEYIVTESADAFLVSLLLLAMKEGEDIEIKAPISAKLFYQIKHYVIPALSLANPGWNKININPISVMNKPFDNLPVAGTGISCGVDSFSTIKDHLNEIEQFQIKYFTFFNVGSHGDYGGESARNIFINRLNLIKPYVESTEIPLIVVDSNLSEILKMNHQQTHTIRAVSCILNLQKLFRFYYYAATHRFDFFKINNEDMAYYETLLLSMLSTESTTFYSAVSPYTRVERTDMITDLPETYNYLNVCVSDRNVVNAKNCSTCIKCLRTQLTLDLIGKLHLYKNVFDIDEYKKRKNKYFGEVIAKRKNNLYFDDIYRLAKEIQYKIPLVVYLYSAYYSIKSITFDKFISSPKVISFYRKYIKKKFKKE